MYCVIGNNIFFCIMNNLKYRNQISKCTIIQKDEKKKE